MTIGYELWGENAYREGYEVGYGEELTDKDIEQQCPYISGTENYEIWIDGATDAEYDFKQNELERSRR